MLLILRWAPDASNVGWRPWASRSNDQDWTDLQWWHQMSLEGVGGSLFPMMVWAGLSNVGQGHVVVPCIIMVIMVTWWGPRSGQTNTILSPFDIGWTGWLGKFFVGVIFSKNFKHQVQDICGQVHWLKKPMPAYGKDMPRNSQILPRKINCPHFWKKYPLKQKLPSQLSLDSSVGRASGLPDRTLWEAAW